MHFIHSFIHHTRSAPTRHWARDEQYGVAAFQFYPRKRVENLELRAREQGGRQIKKRFAGLREEERSKEHKSIHLPLSTQGKCRDHPGMH
jgi:hypothetical protein